ncbi:MAG: hypothetical protein WC413_02510 [Candidatus Nanoarchaeia archaeon]
MNESTEFNTREWIKWGEWIHIPIQDIIERISKEYLIEVIEFDKGIKITDYKISYNQPQSYLLLGRRPDWRSNHVDLEDWEIIKKVPSVTNCSGKEVILKEPQYIDYGSVCLGRYDLQNIGLVKKTNLTERAINSLEKITKSLDKTSLFYMDIR